MIIIIIIIIIGLSNFSHTFDIFQGSKIIINSSCLSIGLPWTSIKRVAQLLLRKSRSYGVVWNNRARRAACLFQMWKFLRFTCSQVTMNGYGSGDREFEGTGSVSWVKICKIMFLAGDGALPSQLFRPCYRMYRLTTIHFVTDNRPYWRVQLLHLCLQQLLAVSQFGPKSEFTTMLTHLC